MNTVFARLFTLVHISAVALLCAASGQWSTAIADDTEVFFSTPASQGGANSANVLLFIDNSASMNQLTSSTTNPDGSVQRHSRASRLVEGTKQLLDTIVGVDVGLATFNGSGASIIQPMRPLDAPALDASTYSGRVDRSKDDAAISGGERGQGQFRSFTNTPFNTPLAPIYIRQSNSTTNPIIPSVAGMRDNVRTETVSLNTDVMSVADSDVVGATNYNDFNLAVISPSSLTLPGSPGLSYAPLGVHFDGARTIPVRTFIRVDTRDLAVGVRDRIRNGCVLKSYVEFQAAIGLADPEQATKMLIQVFPNSISAPAGLDQTKSEPGEIRSLPTTDSATSFVALRTPTEMGSIAQNSAPPLRWDAVPASGTFRTPDLSQYIQTGIDNAAFDSTVDDGTDNNENILITFSPRTILDGDIMNDLSLYGLQPDFLTNPPPARDVLAHNADAELNPRLFITFSDEPCRVFVSPSASKYMLGAVFRDVRIPRGATITDARLHLRPAGDYLAEEEFRMNVYVGSVADPDTIAWEQAVPSLIDPGRENNVMWADPARNLGLPTPDPSIFTTRTSGVQWTTFQDIASPDLSRLVQGVVDGPNWCGGNSIVVYVEPRKPGNNRRDKTSDATLPRPSDYQVTQNQLRSFHTFDSAAELAPRLEIAFGDPVDVTDACNVYEKSFFFKAADVGMQKVTAPCAGLYGDVRFNSNFGDSFSDDRLHFMHFRDIDLPEDVEVLQSRMFLPNRRDIDDNVSDAFFPEKLSLYAHLPAVDGDALGRSSGLSEPHGFVTRDGVCQAKFLFDNQRAGPALEWDLGTDAWDDPADPIYGDLPTVYRESPDLTSLLTQVVNNGSVWRNTKQFTVIMHSDTSIAASQGYREIGAQGLSVFRPIPDSSMPFLRVRYRSSVFAGGNIRTHREQLINTVQNLTFTNTFTPHHAALRESLTYFRNEEVFYGRRRAPGGDPSAAAPFPDPVALLNSRVSTVRSHNGSIIRPPECTGILSSFDCADSMLSAGARYHTRESTQACETNHVIFITDGAPQGYSDDHKAATEAFISANAPGLACGTDIPCIDENDPLIEPYVRQSEVPGLVEQSTAFNRLAKYMSSDMYTAPNNPDNEEPIKVHTVSFDIGGGSTGSRYLAEQVLRTMATSGGGGFYSTGDAGGLLLALREILTTATAAGASLAAPSLTINSFNSLFTLDEIYVSMFVPDSNSIAWEGNIKKYRLRSTCPPGDTSCTIGELLDANGNPVLDSNSNINPSTKSLWSTSADGADVTAGGAASVMRSQSPFPRKIFTDDGPSTATLTVLSDGADYRLMNGMNGNAPALSGDLRPQGTASAEDLIEWWRGKDIDDENGNGVTTDENRWLIQDSLHTSIVPIIFGLDATRGPILKLFTTTNAGEIRLINGFNGSEEWRYIPRDQLGKASDLIEPGLADLSDNPTSNRLYGIDGPMTSMVFDCNGDGEIQSSVGAPGCGTNSQFNRDRVLLFATQRRGGDKIYAIDAVPSTSISDASSLNDISARFLWTIDAQTPGYTHLGQTWSAPIPLRVYVGDADGPGGSSAPGNRLVVAFSAGYDSNNDRAVDRSEPAAVSRDDQPTLRGTGIYMADMLTGDCVLYIGPTSEADCEHSTVVPAMKYSIPMTPGFLNSGLQGGTARRRGIDRFYFADLGGQVFRVDLNQAQITSSSRYAVVKKIADLGQEADSTDQPQNRRHFHTTPIVVPVRGDYIYSDREADYDLVILGSGNRPYPLSTGAQDRAYVLRDINATSIYSPTDTIVPLKERDLVDVSRALPALADLRTHSGFYFNLDRISDLNGEKIISHGAVLAGQWFFTSFEPGTPGFDAACMTHDQGLSRLYAINILDAQPSIDQNGNGTIDIDDRSSIISSGVVSDIATAFLEGGTALLVNAEGGSRTLDVGGALGNLDTPVVQSRRQW